MELKAPSWTAMMWWRCTAQRRKQWMKAARDAGPTYIGGIERGERNVALVNIEKIAKALRISLPELFRGV